MLHGLGAESMGTGQQFRHKMLTRLANWKHDLPGLVLEGTVPRTELAPQVHVFRIMTPTPTPQRLCRLRLLGYDSCNARSSDLHELLRPINHTDSLVV